MKLILQFSLLGLVFCNLLKNDIRNFCAKCITSMCDKSKMTRDLIQWSLKECKQIQDQRANTKEFEYNKERDLLDLSDWTKNQVGIYFQLNQKYIKRGAKLPMPNCLGTLISPRIILTDASCVPQK